jgi:multiple sugar transport system permease protein
VFFLPTVCAGVGILLLWKLMMYNPQFGMINLVLAQLGVEGPKWLQDYP